MAFPLPCALTLILFDPLSMNIPTITSLYSESHAPSFAKLSLSPDPNGRSALDFKVQLSSSSNAPKLLSTCQSNALVPPIVDFLPVSAAPPNKRYNISKKNLFKKFSDNLLELYNDKIQPLLTQGPFLNLLHLEASNPDWKSFSALCRKV